MMKHEYLQRYLHQIQKAAGKAILQVATAQPGSVPLEQIHVLHGKYAMVRELNKLLTGNEHE
jgi:hypothetical protein